MKFNLEQVALFSLALFILLIAASSLLVSPLAWMEAVVHEIVHVFDRKPTTSPVLAISSPSREKTLTEELKLSDNQSYLRYETLSPSLVQSLNTHPLSNPRLDQLIEQSATLDSEKMPRIANYLQRLSANQDLNAEEWSEVGLATASADEFLRNLASVSKDSGNSVDAMDFLARKTANPAILQQSVEMLCLKGFELIRNGQSVPALELVASAAKLARSSAIASMAAQKAQTQAMDTAVDSWSKIIHKETDAYVIEASLHQMNALSSAQHEALGQVREPISRDLLSRFYDMSPGEIGAEIERVAPDYLLKKYAAQKEKVLEKMAQVSPNDPRIESTRKKFEAEIAELNQQVQQALDRRSQAETGAANQSMDPQTAAEEVVQAKLDLLRIKTASIVADKTGGDIQGDIDRLVPRFIPFQPQDPFSKTNFRIDEDNHLAYSVGPDLKDDGARVMYDATNGTLSAGDVMIAVP